MMSDPGLLPVLSIVRPGGKCIAKPEKSGSDLTSEPVRIRQVPPTPLAHHPAPQFDHGTSACMFGMYPSSASGKTRFARTAHRLGLRYGRLIQSHAGLWSQPPIRVKLAAIILRHARAADLNPAFC
jgi:hypothetical protein